MAVIISFNFLIKCQPTNCHKMMTRQTNEGTLFRSVGFQHIIDIFSFILCYHKKICQYWELHGAIRNSAKHWYLWEHEICFWLVIDINEITFLHETALTSTELYDQYETETLEIPAKSKIEITNLISFSFLFFFCKIKGKQRMICNILCQKKTVSKGIWWNFQKVILYLLFTCIHTYSHSC